MNDHRARSSSWRRAVALLGGVALIGGGWYFGVWGFYGISMGEARYEEEPGYLLMFLLGLASIVSGLFLVGRTLRHYFHR